MTVVVPIRQKAVVNKKNNKEIQQIVECQIKYTQFTYETPVKVLTQLTEWVLDQKNHYIKNLPTLSSIFELYDIVTVGYDEKNIDDVMKGIMAGQLEPSKWNTFVIDRNLTEFGWPVYKRVNQDGEVKVSIM